MLYDWLCQTAEKFPDKIAFFDEEESLTFSELLEQSVAISKSDKMKDGSAILPVSARREPFVTTTFLGAAFSGSTYAPIPENMPEEKIQTIMMKLILGQNPIGTKGEKPLMVLQTSGTSGQPKGVCISEASLCHYIESFGQAMEISSEEILGCQADFDYVACIRDIYLPVRYGCSTAIIPKEYFMNPMKLHAFLKESGVTTLCWSVSAMTMVAKLGALQDYDFSFIKKVIFTGSAINGGILHKWQMALPNATFINHYGPSEVTASCTYYRVDHQVKVFEQIPIGDTLPGYDVFLLPAPGEELEKAERRYEICVAGPGLAIGYFDDPLLTQQKFEVRDDLGTPEPVRIYHTGDLGRVDENGNLVFCGRLDRQIKHMDYRVELDAIEYEAMRFAGISEVAVANDEKKDKICMFYVGDAEVEDLIDFLKSKLPHYMVPRKTEKLAELPRLANGKVDYQALIPKEEVKKVKFDL